VHGIIVIVGAGLKPAPTEFNAQQHGVPEIIRAFKTFSARMINQIRRTPGAPFWHRNYYEHIVRNEQELSRIREYIENNPLTWQLDRENPKSQNFNMSCSSYWDKSCER
jgi:putative transposase